MESINELLTHYKRKAGGDTGTDCATEASEATKQRIIEGFYQDDDSGSMIHIKKPWKGNPRYFKKVYVSSLALTKMAVHANSGGNIEVMGMMTGKVVANAMVVLDVYALPVEGTETRVNAQAEGYEYMVSYLENLKKVGRKENIVGWYHSHPGYGCWLSGIDVATQALNQNFQDPYLAIVIDPQRTRENWDVDIGAFRTFPENYNAEGATGGGGGGDNNNYNNTNKNVPESKQKDFGVHSSKYYSLEVEVFQSAADTQVIDILQKTSWISKLTGLSSLELKKRKDTTDLTARLMDMLRSQQITRRNRLETCLNRKFDLIFEEIMASELLNDIGCEHKSEYDDDNDKYNEHINEKNDEFEIEKEGDNDPYNSIANRDLTSDEEMNDDESDLDDGNSKCSNYADGCDTSDAGNDDVGSVESTASVNMMKKADFPRLDSLQLPGSLSSTSTDKRFKLFAKKTDSSTPEPEATTTNINNKTHLSWHEEKRYKPGLSGLSGLSGSSGSSRPNYSGPNSGPNSIPNSVDISSKNQSKFPQKKPPSTNTTPTASIGMANLQELIAIKTKQHIFL